MKASTYSPVYALSVIGGKWKMPILWALSEHGTLRYSQIRAELDISHRVLSRQLDELEADGLILRTLHPVVPPKVEYELTELGKRTLPAICAICELGAILKLELTK